MLLTHMRVYLQPVIKIWIHTCTHARSDVHTRSQTQTYI
jgi:hypothetical protein